RLVGCRKPARCATAEAGAWTPRVPEDRCQTSHTVPDLSDRKTRVAEEEGAGSLRPHPERRERDRFNAGACRGSRDGSVAVSVHEPADQVHARLGRRYAQQAVQLAGNGLDQRYLALGVQLPGPTDVAPEVALVDEVREGRLRHGG